jgi:hypothetical protein
VGALIDSLRKVAHHFAVVAGIPAVLVTAYILVLLSSGAPTRKPNLHRALSTVEHLTLGDLAVLVVVVIAIGLVMSPFQFGVTQLLEGYWGPTTPALRGMRRGAGRHLDQALALRKAAERAGWKVSEADEVLADLAQEEQALLAQEGGFDKVDLDRIEARQRALLFASLPDRLKQQEADRVAAGYPVDPAEIMPTRLGNVLRRYERLAGAAFDLDAVTITPLLAQVADPTVRDYIDDARTDLDLATQMVLVWVIWTVVGAMILWRWGFWLLLPASSALLSLLAYRGAVNSAQAYGEALIVLVVLGRKGLYDGTGLGPPRNTEEECARNKELMLQLGGSPARYDYRWPPAPPPEPR